MKIEILEANLNDMDANTGECHSWVLGDVAEVSDEYGARLCSFGWARDIAGAVPTGERKPGVFFVLPQKRLVAMELSNG